MRSEIEALLRACDAVFAAESTVDKYDAECALAKAAAAVRAELAREPVELSDEQLLTAYASAIPTCGMVNFVDSHGLRAVARAARGESK